VLQRPIQHIQVPAKSGGICLLIPRARQACSRANFNTSWCPPCAAAVVVLLFHSQPCSRAHCNTARCPPRAAGGARLRIPRAPVLPRPLHHLQVAFLSGEYERPVGPRAPVLVLPSQPLDDKLLTSSGTSSLTPARGRSDEDSTAALQPLLHAINPMGHMGTYVQGDRASTPTPAITVDIMDEWASCKSSERLIIVFQAVLRELRLKNVRC
jgi:hypothetical protein